MTLHLPGAALIPGLLHRDDDVMTLLPRGVGMTAIVTILLHFEEQTLYLPRRVPGTILQVFHVALSTTLHLHLGEEMITRHQGEAFRTNHPHAEGSPIIHPLVDLEIDSC